MIAHRARIGLVLLAASASAAGSGCVEGRIDDTYGRMRGRSINGTGAFANLLRDRGHEVRAARRLSVELADWADTIVRFAPESGPIDDLEAEWYLDWQLTAGDRRLVYVCRDGEATAEFWQGVLGALPSDAPEAQRSRIEARRDAAADWDSEESVTAIDEIDKEEVGSWFLLEEIPTPSTVAGSLEGPWAEGVDPVDAALPVHRALELDHPSEVTLIAADGRPLAIEWSWEDIEYEEGPSEVLIVANGSFLLNAAIVNRARRPLTLRTAQWIGEGPRRIAFVEGAHPFAGGPGMPTPLEVIRAVPALGVAAGHFIVMALAAALARALILGRPRAAPPSGADRPRAHAEALGHLLDRVGTPAAARSLLDSYRRWRRPQGPGSS